MTTGTHHTLASHMLRALRLDPTLYREVRFTR